MVTYKDKKFYEDGLIFSDASLFNVFTFPLVQGDPEKRWKLPIALVISEGIAQKYFGNRVSFNETLTINEQEYLITGIMQETLPHSHFHADMFASLKTLEQMPSVQERYFKSWARHEFYTYLLLRDRAAAQIFRQNCRLHRKTCRTTNTNDLWVGTLHSQLQPLQSIHLHSHLQHEISPTGDIKYITDLCSDRVVYPLDRLCELHEPGNGPFRQPLQ